MLCYLAKFYFSDRLIRQEGRTAWLESPQYDVIQHLCSNNSGSKENVRQIAQILVLRHGMLGVCCRQMQVCPTISSPA